MKSLLAFMILYWLLTFSVVASAPTGTWTVASFHLIRIEATNTRTEITDIEYRRPIFEEDQDEKKR